MKGLSSAGVKRPRLSYANIMSTIAVFIALGGVSWAAISIPRNSVGPAQLKRGAVDSVRVKDKSLLAKDIKPGQVFAPRAWAARVAESAEIGSSFTDVSAIYVPAGDLTATVSTTLVRWSLAPTAVCQLAGTTATPGSGTVAQGVTLKDAAGSTPVRPFSLTSAFRMSSPGTIKLSCLAFGGTIKAFQTSLTAVSVKSATITSG